MTTSPKYAAWNHRGHSRDNMAEVVAGVVVTNVHEVAGVEIDVVVATTGSIETAIKIHPPNKMYINYTVQRVTVSPQTLSITIATSTKNKTYMHSRHKYTTSQYSRL
jgi:hypothetical protein